MALTRAFDWLYVDPLFGKDEKGQAIFYPNGQASGGYIVPAEQEAGLRSGVRRLAAVGLAAALGMIIVVRVIESWMGAEVPLPWFIGGAVVVFIATFTFIIRTLSRLKAGLKPVARS